MQRDSVFGTLSVAAILCVACSVVVSAAAVGLRGVQNRNKAHYEQRNILIAAGLAGQLAEAKAEGKDVADVFAENITTELIDLATGDPVPETEQDPQTFDQRKAAKEPGKSETIPADKDIAGIKRREKYSKVYLLKDGDSLQKVILPVYGKGLWSTLYGFIALEADLNTVAGLTFYEHKETPGLGGEVDNPRWKALWPNKKLRDETGDLQIAVIKGQVAPGSAKADYEVDGLSGATITSRGVSNLVRYWVTDGFGPYLAKLKSEAN